MFTHGQAILGPPTLGEIIAASKSRDILGIADRDAIIDYIQRAIELATWKTNWDPYLGTMDICSDCCGVVTLPAEVGVIVACNVGGFPAQFRNSWFEYHQNGPGTERGPGNAGGFGYGGVGPDSGYTWDDRNKSAVFQDLKEWSYLAAIVENPEDGQGNLSIEVHGDTMDENYNTKFVVIQIPLLNNYAATDSAATQLKNITRVIKPVTKGYVKLIAFPGVQQANGRTIGYYAPSDTAPEYRRIRVNAACKWVRIKYRRSEIRLVDDTDLVPFPSKQAMLFLLKSIRLFETNNLDVAQAYENKAVALLLERQLIEDGPATFKIQVEPGFGMGCTDYR
jgi:hypothetical protein